VKRQHEADLTRGFGRVVLPFALDRKYPSAPTEWSWQFVVTVFERTAATDVIVLPPDGSIITGRQALMKLNQEFFNRSETLFDNKSDEIVVSGDWAFDRGTYRYTETPRAGGSTVITEGNYLWLARREPDGSWRHARIIWNTRQRPTAEPEGFR
jgi:ketosteroid isomerase-like protein